VHHTETNLEIVLCIPGPWAPSAELIPALIQADTGYLLHEDAGVDYGEASLFTNPYGSWRPAPVERAQAGFVERMRRAWLH
jgi:hypothetical protein